MPPTRKITPDVASEIMLAWRLCGRSEITTAELERALWTRGIIVGRHVVVRALHADGWRHVGRGRWSTTPGGATR